MSHPPESQNSPKAGDRDHPRPDHPAPSRGAVFRAQLALLAAPPRLGFFVGLGYLLAQALALASMGLLFGLQIIVTGKDFTVTAPRIDSMGVDPGLGSWGWAIGAMLLVGLVFNGRVWRDTRGHQHDYHWAMPVDRRIHDLLRVAAGSLSLVTICIAFYGVTLLTALLCGHAAPLGRFPAAVWISAVLGPQILFLLASALKLAGGEGRTRYLVVAAAAFLFLNVLAGALGNESLFFALGQVFWGPFGLVTAVAGPSLAALLAGKAEIPGPWLPAFTLWAFLALTAVTAAAGGLRARKRRKP
ncbi:MAG: hypothetical protein KDD47_13290 [Acidobacteria bacterium]|nr:hypothetical protein [Acidobacteriota bacterium]